MTDLKNENQNIAAPESPTPQKQLSPLAKWALYFTGIGFIFIVARVIPVMSESGLMIAWLCWGVASILGICALVQISRSKGKLKGMPRSLVAICISLTFIYVGMADFSPPPLAFRLMCGTRLNGLGLAMAAYAKDYDGRLPTTSQWCDLLIERADVGVGQFVCHNSDTLRGESSYAMNKYIADMNMEQLPADVVVLFETDSGQTAKRGWWKLRQMRKHNDEYYSITESNSIPKLTRSDKLDKLRWNQVGGPEILTTEHHSGKGCNILFADGHVSFETTETIPTLRWKP